MWAAGDGLQTSPALQASTSDFPSLYHQAAGDSTADYAHPCGRGRRFSREQEAIKKPAPGGSGCLTGLALRDVHLHRGQGGGPSSQLGHHHPVSEAGVREVHGASPPTQLGIFAFRARTRRGGPYECRAIAQPHTDANLNGAAGPGEQSQYA
ncbi:MAG: hypothetical protein Q7R34_05090 [Dehalococcoidia bacterium]|nr:hypothetical protein [Dehalococcoidia bacterium]